MCYHKTILIEGLPHIPSVNAQYRPSFGRKGRGKRRHLRFRKDPTIRSFQDVFLEKLQEIIVPFPPKRQEKKKTAQKIFLNYGFVFYFRSRSFLLRDASNAIKCVEDVCTKACGIDDRYALSLFAHKVRLPKGEEEEKIEIFIGYHEEGVCLCERCESKEHYMTWIRRFISERKN